MNKNTKFGIISGAGPMAGALLYQRVIEMLQEKIGAWKDDDFPKILLYNVQFSEMLLGDVNNNTVRGELIAALEFMVNYVDYIYIACQTLHIFLSQEEICKYKVVNLISLVKPYVNNKKAYVVASRTSRSFDLHSKLLDVTCEYLAPEKSDISINQILKGSWQRLEWLESLAKYKSIILGCTEFSVATRNSDAEFIDPIDLAASDILLKYLHV